MVEKLREFCGPPDPAVAKLIRPKSLRARQELYFVLLLQSVMFLGLVRVWSKTVYIVQICLRMLHWKPTTFSLYFSD